MKPSAGGGAQRATRSEASETDDATKLVGTPAHEVEPSAGGGAQRATRSEASDTDDATMLVGIPAHEVEPSAGGGAQRATVTSVATLHSLTAMRTVDSATERSLPGVPGQVTVAASFHRCTGIAVAALSRSGVEPGVAYGVITVVQA